MALTEDSTKNTRRFEPDLFLYDTYPGGIGLSAPLFKLTRTLLTGAAEVIRRCACEAGCPARVGPVGEIREQGKDAVLRILDELRAMMVATAP